MLMKSTLLATICTLLIPQAMVAASAQALNEVSLKGLVRYKDAGGGELIYYEPSAVPEAQDTKFVFGSYISEYPDKGRMIPVRTDVGYIVNCKRERITQAFEALHITPATLAILPSDIQEKAIKENADRMVKVKDLNFTSPSRLVYMKDTAALEVACKYK